MIFLLNVVKEGKNSPSAAIVPNFNLPMRSYEVKNRTSTDGIKSLRLITAIKTPYLPDGRFDLEAYDSLVNMQIEDGADGVIVGGTTGEGQLMSWDEHIMLIGHTINCFGTAIKVIGNTGSKSTREAVHATEQGFAVGMHAAIKTPYLPDGRFDLQAYDSLVNMQIEDGADGVIVGGTTGEGQLMSWDEHIMLIGHTINCFGTAIKVIGNTGSKSTREAVHATEQGFAVGMHAAIKTPYLPDGRFDLQAYDSLVNMQIEDGADGVIVGGTTGEGQLMSWDEHIMLIGHTINCFGTAIKVIGNTGSNSTREAVHATEQGFAVGMHAALHINPYYGKTSLEGMVAHFQCVLPMGPTIIYNVPSRTGQDIPPRVIHSIVNSTNFAGIKECVGHDRVKEYTKNGITVWSGNDDECHDSKWDHDATGVISVTSNLVPGLMRELLSNGKNPSLNKKLLPLISWLFCEPNPIGVNTALAQLGVIRPIFRLPYVPLPLAKRVEFVNIVKEIGREHFIGEKDVGCY